MNYKNFQINTPADVRPWGARESQAWKDVIDNVLLDCIQTTSDVTGHKHYRLYDQSAVVRLSIDNNAQCLLLDPNCAHDITWYYNTTAFGVFEPIDPGAGGDMGLRVVGLCQSNDNHGLELMGILGDENPTDSISAIRFTACKKNGITTQAIDAVETGFDFANLTTILMTLTGAPVLGIGTQTFDAAAVNYLAIKNGTFPSAHTDDQIYIGSADSEGSLSTISINSEEPVKVAAFGSNRYVEIKWNGSAYALLLYDITGV